jgi:hypothetical protein
MIRGPINCGVSAIGHHEGLKTPPSLERTDRRLCRRPNRPAGRRAQGHAACRIGCDSAWSRGNADPSHREPGALHFSGGARESWEPTKRRQSWQFCFAVQDTGRTTARTIGGPLARARAVTVLSLRRERVRARPWPCASMPALNPANPAEAIETRTAGCRAACYGGGLAPRPWRPAGCRLSARP